MSTPELVSAVIPTLRRPELLRKAVLSALHQTYSSIEVVVVVDGEDRATEQSLAGIHDQRLRVVRLAVNTGGSQARNIGVWSARGAWIAFLDDDDEWLPQKIALQMETAKASRAAFPVISSRIIVRTPTLDLVRPARMVDSRLPLSEQLFCRGAIGDPSYALQTSTLLMRRETMLAIPFRNGLKMHQDWDWLLRAAHHPQVRFHLLPDPLTIFRTEDARQSVGRALDWQFSLQWGQEMRQYFTPKAYSFFIATECVSRAAKVRAGSAAYASLAWEYVARGSPGVRSLVWLIGFLCIPERWRRRARELLRRRSSSTHYGETWATRSETPTQPADSNLTLEPNFTGATMQPTEYTQKYLKEVEQIAMLIDGREIDRIVELLSDTRSRGGRVFFLGVGGGAGHAGHAVNDFRKIAGIECYAPTDNVSELTARINDDGWISCYANWLRGSRLRPEDALFIFSVGGGCLERNISANIVESLRFARRIGAQVVGVVGRDGGYTAQVADACVIIPTLSADTVTAHAESFQAVVWHLIVSHPRLKRNEMKWEQTSMVGAERSFSIAMA